MIVNFKITAEAETQEEVRDQLNDLALAIIREAQPSTGTLYWECTADVITGSRQEGFRGRMSFVYHPEGE
jgi:hypothetical protein